MNWTHIILHHSLTKDGQVVDTQAIRRYHTSYRIDGTIVSEDEFTARKAAGQGHLFEEPWSDIGYHFLIEMIKDEYEILMGRPMNESGAHTKGMNDKALGVCYVGNFDIAPPPPEMIEKSILFLRSLCDVFDIPIANIKGHRDYAPKTCPGSMFDLDNVRRQI